MFKVVKNTRRNRRSTSPEARSTSTMAFFDAESASAFLRPWLRLERGLRLQKFRQFSEEYPDLKDEERDILYKALVKANDSKQLNTKVQIQYENEKILGIRGLRIVRNKDAPTQFKIDSLAKSASRPTKKTIKAQVKNEDTETPASETKD
jgi:hypothetical protein